METDTSTPVKCTHDNESSGITPEQKNAKMEITSSSNDTSIEDNKQTETLKKTCSLSFLKELMI